MRKSPLLYFIVALCAQQALAVAPPMNRRIAIPSMERLVKVTVSFERGEGHLAVLDWEKQASIDAYAFEKFLRGRQRAWTARDRALARSAADFRGVRRLPPPSLYKSNDALEKRRGEMRKRSLAPAMNVAEDGGRTAGGRFWSVKDPHVARNTILFLSNLSRTSPPHLS
jgi:hypothetical protein